MNLTSSDSGLDEARTIFWVYVVPVICLLGIFTNSLCILGFIRLKLEHEIFKFMKLISLVDLFYLMFISLFFLSRCKASWCQFSTSYVSQLYLIVVDAYLTSCMAIFNILIDLTISVQRFLIVSNVKVFEKLRFWRIVIPIGLVSLVYYTPELFTKRIVQVQLSDTERGANSTRIGFALEPNAFGETQASRLILSMLGIIRGPGTLVLLLIINSATVLNFRRLLTRKKILRGGSKSRATEETGANQNASNPNLSNPVPSKTSNNRQANKKTNSNNSLTRMTVCMSFSYILLSTPYTIFYILIQFKSVQSLSMTIFELISFALLFIYHGFHFFHYYVFNRQFRQIYSFKGCF
nr:G protein-coupled receptor [Proales similis]